MEGGCEVGSAAAILETVGYCPVTGVYPNVSSMVCVCVRERDRQTDRKRQRAEGRGGG